MLMSQDVAGDLQPLRSRCSLCAALDDAALWRGQLSSRFLKEQQYLGAEDDATAWPQRRALAALPRVAAALLRVRLSAATAHLCTRLGAGCALQVRALLTSHVDDDACVVVVHICVPVGCGKQPAPR